MIKTLLIVAFTGLSITASAGTTCAPESSKLIECTLTTLNQIGNVALLEDAGLISLVTRQCGWQMRLVTLCTNLDESIAKEIVGFQVAAYKANLPPSK